MNNQGGIMENAELIKALKEDAEWAHANEWETPITLGDHLDAAAAALERLTAERDAAVEDMTAVLKRDSDDICAYCKKLIECKGEGCECFEQGKGGTIDGKEYPDFKWTCMDFDYGTCSLLEDTPCNGCIEDDCTGFEWRGQQAEKGAAPNE